MSDGPTKEQVDLIAGAIENHCPRDFAATQHGVSPETLERWIEDGAIGEGGQNCLDLAQRVYRAEGQNVQTQMGRLNEMSIGDPMASKLYLELQHGERFGGKPRKSHRDEFALGSRNKRKRANLLASPPPRMLAELREHGWWQFSPQLDDEDRETLSAIQRKYLQAPQLEEGTAEG